MSSPPSPAQSPNPIPGTTPSPSTRTEQSRGRSCLTAAALFIAYAIGSAFLLMLPTGFIGPVFVGGGFVLVCVIGVHYLIWGRWLTQLLAEEARRQRDADQRLE